MKAQLFESKSEKEIRLSNGVQIMAEAGETKEDFVSRVSEVIERDYLETLELSEVDIKDMKKKSTKQLQKARKSATGVELRMMQEILVDRGALEEHANSEGAIANTTLTDDDIPAEGSSEDVASNEEGKKAKDPKSKDPKSKEPKSKEPKAKEPKATKTQKPLKKQLTDEEILSKLEESGKNKGHEVKFLCTKTKAEATGIIKGVRLDKRNNFIQYRIEVLESDSAGNETKVMYGKGVDSEDLKIGGLVPVPEKPKAEKVKKEKAPKAETEAAPVEDAPADSEGSIDNDPLA